MSMAWSKIGRWLLLGFVGLGGAAACGGRGSLPSYGDADGGELPIAGTNSVSGSGGKAGAGGTSLGGTGGTCTPGSIVCVGESGLAVCDSAGNRGPAKPCAKGQSCVQSGSSAKCTAQICKPGQRLCDASGTLVEVCSADGSSLSTQLDCASLGQRCESGACTSLVCKPNQLFCDASGVRLCNAVGTGSTSWLDCAANQYCDPAALACKQGICVPNKPACNASVATTCNSTGSGYVGGGVNCAPELDQVCVQGACQCTDGLGNCDGINRNGCETDISNDPDNCSGCGLICSSNHIVNRTCNDACTGTCESGYRDCNGSKLKDGCETSIATDVKNCGACGVTCSTNHVTASCTQGVCGGQCATNFADCNMDKQDDGCESDLRSDSLNCGSCGSACSTNHVKARCASGTCNGSCEQGFADCNLDKRADGCEVDTQNDALNCGACGASCSDDQACLAGKCVDLLKFTGVAQNVPVASLVGWTLCSQETYGSNTTSIAAIQKACTGSLLMMACRPKGSSTLQLVAYAPRADVMFDTGHGNFPHNANGVSWYFSDSYSWGFAPLGDEITRSSCDIQGSSLSTGVDGDKRLCWHTSLGNVSGGWRCGTKDALNADQTYERLLFTAQ
jgi:hypothetical protein